MKKIFAVLFVTMFFLTGCGDDRKTAQDNKDSVNWAAVSKQAIQSQTGKLVTDFSIRKFREFEVTDGIKNTDGVIEIDSDGVQRKFKAQFDANTQQLQRIQIDPPLR